MPRGLRRNSNSGSFIYTNHYPKYDFNSMRRMAIYQTDRYVVVSCANNQHAVGGLDKYWTACQMGLACDCGGCGRNFQQFDILILPDSLPRPRFPPLPLNRYFPLPFHSLLHEIRPFTDAHLCSVALSLNTLSLPPTLSPPPSLCLLPTHSSAPTAVATCFTHKPHTNARPHLLRVQVIDWAWDGIILFRVTGSRHARLSFVPAHPSFLSLVVLSGCRKQNHSLEISHRANFGFWQRLQRLVQTETR